jgi:hypothetical protein
MEACASEDLLVCRQNAAQRHNGLARLADTAPVGQVLTAAPFFYGVTRLSLTDRSGILKPPH